MKHWIHKHYNKLLMPKQRSASEAAPGELGFHGDLHYRALADSVLEQSEFFIETGSFMGDTTFYVGSKFPNVSVVSCEPDTDRFNQALNATTSLENVKIHNLTSQELIELLSQQNSHWYSKLGCFFLDAHGYGFEWPLKQEIAFISECFERSFILIDDFLVPGYPNFGYDIFDPHVCSHDYIVDSFAKTKSWRLFYPKYWKRTSRYRPLRGWGLYLIGQIDGFSIPDEIKDDVWEF